MSHRLELGDLAPGLSGQDIWGRPFGLEQYRGKKVLLCFYRYARCPLCQLNFSVLLRNVAAIRENGCEIVAIFDSPVSGFPKSFLEDREKTKGVILVADPGGDFYRAMSIERSWKKLLKLKNAIVWLQAQLSGFFQSKADGPLNRVPAQFLIREDGIIHSAFYGDSASDQIPLWQIGRFIREESVEEWKMRTRRA